MSVGVCVLAIAFAYGFLLSEGSLAKEFGCIAMVKEANSRDTENPKVSG